MSPEWVTAVATVFTALVISASAVAALLQIRHMRKSNEIEIIQKWTEAVESSGFEHARLFVTRDLPQIMADPARARALSWNPLPPELAEIRTICNHFESVGAYVKLGSVEARVATELWAYVVLDCWRAIAPVTAVVRKRTGKDGIWENFEYLAMLSARHIDVHKDGTYPANVARMPIDHSLMTILEDADANG